MPELDEIKKATEINKLGDRNARYVKYIYVECPVCHKRRWRAYLDRRAHPNGDRCRSCSSKSRSGIASPFWQGGRNTGRYIEIKLYPDDFFYPMVSRLRGYVLEHRLVMAKSLGRNLQSWEIIHHKNGDKLDNRIENLELTTNGSHTIAHSKGYKDGYQQGYYEGKDKRIKELEAQIKELGICLLFYDEVT